MYKPIIDNLYDLYYYHEPSDVTNFAINICIYFKNEFSDYVYNFWLRTPNSIVELIERKSILSISRTFFVNEDNMKSNMHILEEKIHDIMNDIYGDSIINVVNKLTSYFIWEYEDIMYDIWISESRFIEKRDVGTIKPILYEFEIKNRFNDINNFHLNILIHISDDNRKEISLFALEILTPNRLSELVEMEGIVHCKGKFIVNENDMESNIQLVKNELEIIFEDCKRETWQDVLIAVNRYLDNVN